MSQSAPCAEVWYAVKRLFRCLDDHVIPSGGRPRLCTATVSSGIYSLSRHDATFDWQVFRVIRQKRSGFFVSATKSYCDVPSLLDSQAPVTSDAYPSRIRFRLARFEGRLHCLSYPFSTSIPVLPFDPVESSTPYHRAWLPLISQRPSLTTCYTLSTRSLSRVAPYTCILPFSLPYSLTQYSSLPLTSSMAVRCSTSD